MEKLFDQLIEEFEKSVPNNFNYTEHNKQQTISLLYALQGFHTEEGTTIEQNDYLKSLNLQT